MAEGLSNEKVSFKGLVKTGVSEMLAVQHRQSKDVDTKYRSAMLGIITDSVVRRQEQHERYIQGVKNVARVAFEVFKGQTAA